MEIKQAIDYLRTIADSAHLKQYSAALDTAIRCMEEVEVLRKELRAERDRFDRLTDFELAEAKELEPYRELGQIEHLRDMLQAEQDGRLVVLPCKVGDTAWVIGEKRIILCEIDEAYLDDKWGLEYLVSFDCDSDCDGCPFNNWHQDYSGEYSCDGEYGQGTIVCDDFGKTVFLSREEAEAALAGKGETHA